MATCCHRRSCLRAGKARNAVVCLRVSAGKMIASSPELTQRTRSWSVFLIYIINLSYDIEIMDLLENQDYLDYKQPPLPISSFMHVTKNQLVFLNNRQHKQWKLWYLKANIKILLVSFIFFKCRCFEIFHSVSFKGDFLKIIIWFFNNA